MGSDAGLADLLESSPAVPALRIAAAEPKLLAIASGM